MAFVSQITDDFNRADSTDLGANWSKFVGDLNIYSNTLKTITRTGYWIGARYLTTPTTTEQYAQFYSAYYQNDMGICLRWQNSTTFYACRFRTSDILFMRGDGGTDPTLLLDSADTATGATGHTYKFSVTGTGATVTLKSYYDGTETFSYDDTAAGRIVSNGYVGVFAYGTNAQYDNFDVGIISTPSTFIPMIKFL